MARALVLSGGGAVGIAWQTGFAAGLASEGLELADADADAIVGTSAGSATGAQLALRFDMAKRVDRYRQRTGERVRGTVEDTPAGGGGRRGGGALSGLMEVMRAAQNAPGSQEERRATIGAFALAAETGREEPFVESFRYLDGHDWPAHYRCTAVDAESGAFVAWDQAAGVPLATAVASSCAVPGVYPPITINGRRYIDGGMRSGTNADLVAGHDKVLIVSMRANTAPSGDAEADARIARARVALDREQQILRDGGADVLLTGPDTEASAAFGPNLLSGSNLAEVAEQGMRQGAKGAAELGDFWAT